MSPKYVPKFILDAKIDSELRRLRKKVKYFELRSDEFLRVTRFFDLTLLSYSMNRIGAEDCIKILNLFMEEISLG